MLVNGGGGGTGGSRNAAYWQSGKRVNQPMKRLGGFSSPKWMDSRDARNESTWREFPDCETRVDDRYLVLMMRGILTRQERGTINRYPLPIIGSSREARQMKDYDLRYFKHASDCCNHQ